MIEMEHSYSPGPPGGIRRTDRLTEKTGDRPKGEEARTKFSQPLKWRDRRYPIAGQ